MKHEIDLDLITALLRSHGHTVGHTIPVPDNGGEYEFEVDGNVLSLAETRALLEAEDERQAENERSSKTHPTTNTHPIATP